MKTKTTKLLIDARVMRNPKDFRTVPAPTIVGTVVEVISANRYRVRWDDAATFTYLRSELVAVDAPACTPDQKRETARAERALRKYGVGACLKAAAANDEGWGPSSILLQVDCGFRFVTVNQVDAAIDAGRWAKARGFKGGE